MAALNQRAKSLRFMHLEIAQQVAQARQQVKIEQLNNLCNQCVKVRQDIYEILQQMEKRNPQKGAVGKSGSFYTQEALLGGKVALMEAEYEVLMHHYHSLFSSR